VVRCRVSDPIGDGEHEVTVCVAAPRDVVSSKEFRIVVEDKEPAG
jgi:hypothetical protein